MNDVVIGAFLVCMDLFLAKKSTKQGVGVSPWLDLSQNLCDGCIL